MKRGNKRRYKTGAALHAVCRALERYDANLSGGDLDMIAAKIRRGEVVKHLAKSTSRREVVVEHKARMWRVIYSKTIKSVITFLPWREDDAQVQSQPGLSAEISGNNNGSEVKE